MPEKYDQWYVVFQKHPVYSDLLVMKNKNELESEDIKVHLKTKETVFPQIFVLFDDVTEPW